MLGAETSPLTEIIPTTSGYIKVDDAQLALNITMTTDEEPVPVITASPETNANKYRYILIDAVEGQQYTIYCSAAGSTSPNALFIDANGIILHKIIGTTYKDRIITVPSNAKWVYFFVNIGTGNAKASRFYEGASTTMRLDILEDFANTEGLVISGQNNNAATQHGAWLYYDDESETPGLTYFVPTNSSSNYQYGVSEPFIVAPGEQYILSLYRNTNSSISPYIITDANNIVIDAQPPRTSGSNTYVTYEFTIPPNGAKLYCTKYATNSTIYLTKKWSNMAKDDSIATSETSLATIAYNVNDLLMLNGHLYKATSAITSGDKLISGTNISQTSVASQLANYIKNTDFATTSSAGIIRINNGYGFMINPYTAEIALSGATSDNIKSGAEVYKAIIPVRQHEAVFYGLAKAAGADMNNSENAVGTYTEAAKTAIKTMIGVEEGLKVVRLI